MFIYRITRTGISSMMLCLRPLRLLAKLSPNGTNDPARRQQLQSRRNRSQQNR